MEINFNTNGGKFAKHDSLMALAENVDQKGKFISYVYELEELDKTTLCRLYDNEQAIILGALQDLIEVITKTLPTKYQPTFERRATEVWWKVKRSYNENDKAEIDKYKQELKTLNEKYGINE